MFKMEIFYLMKSSWEGELNGDKGKENLMFKIFFMGF